MEKRSLKNRNMGSPPGYCRRSRAPPSTNRYASTASMIHTCLCNDSVNLGELAGPEKKGLSRMKSTLRWPCVGKAPPSPCTHAHTHRIHRLHPCTHMNTYLLMLRTVPKRMCTAALQARRRACKQRVQGRWRRLRAQRRALHGSAAQPTEAGRRCRKRCTRHPTPWYRQGALRLFF